MALEPINEATDFQLISDINLEDATYENGVEAQNQLPADSQPTVTQLLPLPCCHKPDGPALVIERVQAKFESLFVGMISLAHANKPCTYFLFVNNILTPIQYYSPSPFVKFNKDIIKTCFIPNSILFPVTTENLCSFGIVPKSCVMTTITPRGCKGHQFHAENFSKESLVTTFQQINTKTFALRVYIKSHYLVFTCKSTSELIETMALRPINQVAGFQLITDVNLEEALNQIAATAQSRAAQILPLPCCHKPGGSAHVIGILQSEFGSRFAGVVSMTYVNKSCEYLVYLKKTAQYHTNLDYLRSIETIIRLAFVPNSILFQRPMNPRCNFGIVPKPCLVIKIRPKGCEGHQFNVENFSSENLITEFQQNSKRIYTAKVYANNHTLLFDCKSTCVE